MIRLSAFADEISADLDEQIAVLRSENISFLDLRGVWNTNVLDLSDAQVEELRQTLHDQGIGVAAIGSPIGKVPIDSPFDEHLQRFERAITLAKIFDTPYIRIFSFYPPANTSSADPAEWRGEVLHRLRELTSRASSADIVLTAAGRSAIGGARRPLGDPFAQRPDLQL
jgi:3-dehydroshikimate dehydratase